MSQQNEKKRTGLMQSNNDVKEFPGWINSLSITGTGEQPDVIKEAGSSF
jgi:hypothetical protein